MYLNLPIRTFDSLLLRLDDDRDGTSSGDGMMV